RGSSCRSQEKNQEEADQIEGGCMAEGLGLPEKRAVHRVEPQHRGRRRNGDRHGGRRRPGRPGGEIPVGGSLARLSRYVHTGAGLRCGSTGAERSTTRLSTTVQPSPIGPTSTGLKSNSIRFSSSAKRETS